METSNPRRTRHLSLDNLTVNLSLAQCLPLALARRCHALPVVKDNGRITVAMADPDDAAARKAIVTALGSTCCVVRGDPATIDALLAEVWPEEAHHSLRLLVCAQASPITDGVEAYAHALGDLLGAHVSHFHRLATTGTALGALVKEVESTGHDLVVFGEPSQSLVKQLFLGGADRKATERVPTSLLIAQRPRWPLKKMLLLIRGEEMDDVAVDWVVRLARPSGASVTVLTVVPPMPAMYHGLARMEQGLAALLAGDSALGWQMHRAAQRLADWEIKSTLRLCQGPPGLVIHREIVEGDYDLVAVAAEYRHRWLRRLLGELVSLLLRWTDRPVLIAKPTTV